MKAGIARKLIRTYFIIIAAMVVSGAFCLYVLWVNLRTNDEMRYVTLPSLEQLKDMKVLMQEAKKLANTWVYIANNRDQEQLKYILNTEYPQLDSNLSANAGKWNNRRESDLFNHLRAATKGAVDSIKKITVTLNKPENYTNDAAVDYAAELNSSTERLIAANDKLFDQLIDTKEANLAKQQDIISYLLDSLYVIVLLSIFVVITVSYFSARYSRKNVVIPLLKLNRTILDMAVGEVVSITEDNRDDEIGEMHNAMNKMIGGIIQKIHFAEQIGKGNYDADFSLLSDKDKLGIALLTMKNGLKEFNEALIIQDKRLVDAQKMARIGNYFYDIETREYQTSPTLDEILGIEKDAPKDNRKWSDYILPEFHDFVIGRAVEAMKEKTKFVESFIIRRINDGKECWVNAIGECNYNDEGRAISMFGTIQDVTESKTLEIERNNSYEIAREQNNRLLNFSYIVSHNLRMHAVNIHGLLNLVETASTDEERKEFLAYLRVSSDQLDETMHQLNEVVAMQNSLKLQVIPISLSGAINHAADLLKVKIEEKKGLIINKVSDSIMVNYNPVYMDSILLNFISNSIKYSYPGRQPVVKLDCYKEHANKMNSRWVLEITDNGLGIDLETNKDKLFGMYKTFHGNEDAKGIGLFMTKYQIEAMGGAVIVESKVNEGTTFRVFIK